jgi:hypothetical protein
MEDAIMWQLRAGLAGLLMLSAAACGASHAPAAAPAPERGAPEANRPESGPEEVPVRIDNQNFSDMNIYFLSRGQRWLLGQAGGLTTTTLDIPVGVRSADDRVRLLADPIGGMGPITTPELIVPAGQTVYWTIGSDPATSSASAG